MGRRSKRVRVGGILTLVACGTLLALAAVAVAAALPKSGAAFTTPAGRGHKLSLTLVTSADGRSIEEGGAALGSQFALSGGSIRCPKAKKAAGFHEVPFALFGFPKTALKPMHGAYGFTVHVVEPEASVLGSAAKRFTLKLKITGTVVDAGMIKGTIVARGGKCTTKKPLAYTAKVNPKVPVAPGA